MNTKNLAGAVCHIATVLIENPTPRRETMLDAATLLRILAQIVEGGNITRSFGTPGDWGYNTPIGKALAEEQA